MALTKDQWFEKLKAWVPSWFFEEEENNEAHFKGLAKILERTQLDADEQLKETFILDAEDDFLDQHGDERSKPRLLGEDDVFYRERIRFIINNSNCPDLKNLVDALLIVGETTILESFDNRIFANRESFFNIGQIFIDPLDEYNYFVVTFQPQIAEAQAFLNVESFISNEAFLGSSNSLPQEDFMDIMNQTLDSSKAGGIAFDIFETTGRGVVNE